MALQFQTYLFVPATKRSLIERVIGEDRFSPDAAIFDFEDALRDVLDGENESSLKISARETLASLLPFPRGFQKKYYLRINSVESPPFEADIEFLNQTRNFLPLGIVLPKVEGPDDVKKLERKLIQQEKGSRQKVSIIPLIESKKGVAHLPAILASSSRISCFCFGHIDYFFEEGIFPIPLSSVDSEPLRDLLKSLVATAAQNHRGFIDAGFYNRERKKELELHCQYLAYLAGGKIPLGKLVMHPGQISVIGQVPLLPPRDNPLQEAGTKMSSPDEVREYAKKIVETYQNRPDRSRSVCLLGDDIIPPQSYLLAKQYLKN